MFGALQGINVRAGDWMRVGGNYWWLLLVGALACTPILPKLFRRFKDSVPGTIVLAVLFWVCVWRLQVEVENTFLYFNF